MVLWFYHVKPVKTPAEATKTPQVLRCVSKPLKVIINDKICMKVKVYTVSSWFWF